MNYYIYYNLPIGDVTLVSDGESLTELQFGKVKNDGLQQEDKVIKNTIIELEEYFKGERKEFSLNLKPKGTEFQESVWKELIKIPYGETRSYKDIAIAIGNPKASRAVGMANNRNPISIIIPCHRVIGSNKALVGYGGGLDIKEKLLKLEKETL